MVVLDGYQGDRHTISRANSCAPDFRRVLIPGPVLVRRGSGVFLLSRFLASYQHNTLFDAG